MLLESASSHGNKHSFMVHFFSFAGPLLVPSLHLSTLPTNSWRLMLPTCCVACKPAGCHPRKWGKACSWALGGLEKWGRARGQGRGPTLSVSSTEACLPVFFSAPAGQSAEAQAAMSSPATLCPGSSSRACMALPLALAERCHPVCK